MKPIYLTIILLPLVVYLSIAQPSLMGKYGIKKPETKYKWIKFGGDDCIVHYTEIGDSVRVDSILYHGLKITK